LYGYNPANGNGGLYVLESDYPNVSYIPAGATATINGILVSVVGITSSNSVYFQGGSGYVINLSQSVGSISAGTYVEFCWY
jgi:hypothetical protein